MDAVDFRNLLVPCLAWTGLVIILLLIEKWLTESGVMRNSRDGSKSGDVGERRAQDLLREVLGEEQHQALQILGYLEVRSRLVQGRVYRIWQPGLVEVHEQGRFCGRLCLQPVVALPNSDVILLHKVLLEGDEEGYLRTANVLKPPVP